MSRAIRRLGLLLVGVCGAMLCVSSHVSAAIAINGAIGAGEWTGATVKGVAYNPAAPQGNFAAPTNENHVEAYNIYTKGDANYLYVGLEALANDHPDMAFANLYFDTNPPAAN